MAKIDFNLYLISDRLSLPAGRKLLPTLEDALHGGVRAVQLREKDLSQAELLALAEQLRALTDKYDARLLINSCLETALAVAADGVHLPGSNPPVTAARAALGTRGIIGVSTHSVAEVLSAEKAGADFVTFGPVYATPSKARYGTPVGLDLLQEACSIANIPIFALGGVTPEKVAALKQRGCHHAACIGAILNKEVPAAATRRFLKQLSADSST